MTDPFKQGPPEPDKEKSTDQAADKAESLNPARFNAQDQHTQSGNKTDKQNSDDPALSKIDLQLTLPKSSSALPYTSGQSGAAGQSPPFMLKGYLMPEQDKPTHELKNLISNFLNDTKLHDEHKLSSAELKELKQNRERLSSAESLPEAVQSALELKKMYQELRHLEGEVKARDLILGLDPQNKIGRQLFEELERMHPHELATSAHAIAIPEGNGLSKSRLKSCINALGGGGVIVIGDLLIDELLEGRPERISREAPVLILEHVGTELILGGASNAASNLAALGGICHAIGVCGRDEYAKKLGRLFEKAGISHGLVEDPTRPTTVKTRILSSAHALRQQLLRLDRISHEKLNDEIANKVLERFDAVAGSYSAVILSDYRGGLITDHLVGGVMKIAQSKNVQVIVDAQEKFERFRGAALMTPNQPDTEAAVGFKIHTKEQVEEAGRKLLQISGARNVLLTRGGAGMVLFQEGGKMHELPAFNRSEVFDVTGAGDTVVATMTLAMVTGAKMVEAMALGNLAAGIVVKKVGTATTNQKELLDALANLKMAD
jgi:rfaE bifunctional protein kinase chain/domain